LTLVDLSIDGEGSIRMALEGDIAMSTAVDAARLMREGIERLHPKSVCVDLAAVTFFDSAGISALIAAWRAADAAGAGFQVIRASTMIDRKLDLSGLVEHFGMRPPRIE